MRILSLIALLLALLLSTPLAAQHSEQRIIGGDTITVKYTPIDQSTSAARGESGFSRWVNKFVTRDISDVGYGANYSIIGGPAYSSSTSLRLKLIGDMAYRTRSMSLDVEPSRLELSAEISITGYYRVAVDGYNCLGTGRHRLFYHIETATQPTKFWGVSYAESDNDTHGSYTSKRHMAWLRYSYAIARHTYVGVYGDYRYLSAAKCDSYTSLILGKEPMSISTAGFGINLAYDSRNSLTDPKQGIYLGAEYIYRPHQLSNLSQDLWQFTTQFNFYVSLWRGATLAYDLYGEFRPDNTPWLLRSQLGDECRMRGYYEGRYNGNNMISTQLELRQHIWDRLGCVAWGGCGTIFSTWQECNFREILPTYGIGLRWQVRNNSNIRLDFGLGRRCYGFVIGINEAF